MKLFLKTISILLLVFFFLCPGAYADLVTVENWSFEPSKTFTTPNQYEYGITGWENDWGGGLFGGTGAPIVGYIDSFPDGDTIGFLSSGSIWQNTYHPIAANTEITLKLDIGNRNLPGYGLPPEGYDVRLMAYEGTESTMLTHSSLAPEAGHFETLTLSYNALLGDVGKNLGIQIWSGGSQLNFDNVRLSNDVIPHPTPEPATMLLLGTGLLGLAGYGRKKKFFKK